MAVGTIETNLAGAGLRIGVVQARFNEDVCHGLLSACLAELTHLGVADEDVLHVTVPGALEIALALQKMAETEQFDALIAIGAVVSVKPIISNWWQTSRAPASPGSGLTSTYRLRTRY